MIYNNIVKAVFKNRPNRFIAECSIDNKNIIVHVKNTGRCRELLIKDTEVYLEYFSESSRKTKYDLITVNKNGRLINMDSSAPNKAVYEALHNGKNILNIDEPLTFIKMEQKYKTSRFDIYAETADNKIFIEIKGVTLVTEKGDEYEVKVAEAKVANDVFKVVSKHKNITKFALFVIMWYNWGMQMKNL